MRASSISNYIEPSTSHDVPHAHLNYILFDKDYGFKSAGFERVPSSANGNVTEISFESLDITEPGYIYVFVSYSNESGGYVYFDDLQVTHHERLSVVQADDYYPFGMTMAGLEYRRGDIQDNDYLYQGKELNAELDLNWYDFHARMFDSGLGRWMVADPVDVLASPFIGMATNPIIAIDPDGRTPFDIIFNNLNNVELGRIILPGKDRYITVPTEATVDEPFILIPDKYWDAIGFGFEAGFAALGGMSGGFEYVYYLNGPDKGELYMYDWIGGNVGVESPNANIYTFVAGQKIRTDQFLSAKSWEGISNSYTIGGVSYFWTNNLGVGELWPEFKSRTAWEGISIPVVGTKTEAISLKWTQARYSFVENFYFPGLPKVENGKVLFD